MAPGWYPDPWNPQQLRWWDGQQWSPATQAGIVGRDPAEELDDVARDGERARRWLWVGVGTYVVQFLTTVVSIASMRDWFSTMSTSAQRGAQEVPSTPPGLLALSGVNQLSSLLMLAVGVLFAIWLQKAAAWSRRMGLPATHTPVWAFLGFIIPIVSFWFPYQVVRDCFPDGHPDRRLVGRWWALYLSMTFSGIVLAVLTLVSDVLGVAAALVAAAWSVWAGIAARRVVAALTEVQRALLRATGSDPAITPTIAAGSPPAAR